MLRLSLVERVRQRDFVTEMARQAAIPKTEAVHLLRDGARRVTRALRVRDPIQIQGGVVRALDFAGLLRLSSEIELEVVPKFLAASDASWREDFFLIASLAQTGHLLHGDSIRTRLVEHQDLPTLVARAIIDLYWENRRHPLRIYQRRVESVFAVDGDVDPEEFFLPSPEGFQQEIIAFHRANPFNAAIRAAAEVLLSEVRDTATRAQLARVVQDLSPQGRAPLFGTRIRVPSRHRRWQTLYDLSRQILKGFGSDYVAGELSGPGFIVRTWSAWEDLILAAFQAALPGWTVQGQHGFELGRRNGRRFRVWPDVVARRRGDPPPGIVADAKYKIAVLGGVPRIAEGDLYETLAFLRASEGSYACLLYPVQTGAAPLPPGTATKFERVEVESLVIEGYNVEARGIAREGLSAFASRMVANLSEFGAGSGSFPLTPP